MDGSKAVNTVWAVISPSIKLGMIVLTTSDPSSGGRVTEGAGVEKEEDEGLKGIWVCGVNSKFSFDNSEFVFLSLYNFNL